MKLKKSLIVPLVVVVVLTIGGIYLLSTQNSQKSSTNALGNSPVSDSATETNNGEADTEQVNEKSQQKPAQKGSLISLADFNANSASYSDSTKVYFFHAEWCPICKGIEKEINADPSKIPEGVTLIQADFDKEKDLRKKYGVTYQYTFVQIDNNGNEVAQWSASNLDKVIAGIKS